MTQQMIDPYATLEVARGATTRQVRSAYRRLAKRHHPDVHADGRATERMRRINQAWEILSDPVRRADYDASIGGAATAAGYSHWAGVPRRATSAAGTSPQWATYGSAGTYAGAPTNGRGRAYGSVYADVGSDDGPGPLRWAALLLLVPVAVLAAGLLSAAFLPFPLVAFLVILITRRLSGRES